MNEVQNGMKNDAAIDELCKRYENRGINYDPDRKHESESGRKRITDSEFVDYYNSYRDYTPGPNVQFDTTVVLQKIDRERYKKSRKDAPSAQRSAIEDIKDQLKKEADASKSAVGKTVTVKENGVEKKITKTDEGYVIREKRQGVF